MPNSDRWTSADAYFELIKEGKEDGRILLKKRTGLVIGVGYDRKKKPSLPMRRARLNERNIRMTQIKSNKNYFEFRKSCSYILH